MPRHSLPLNALEAFMVTARHLNLTHAAKELCLTQGAVSRKIASLENWFGFALFERHARGLHLTTRGKALLPELEQAFRQLHIVAEQARQKPQSVRLKAPTCAMRWLLPNLLAIEHHHPEIDVVLTTTTDHGINFHAEPFDAAIEYGKTERGELLFDECLTPVVSPVLANQLASQPDNLSRLTFLHPTRDKTDWLLWWNNQPRPWPVMRKNQHFDTMDLAISAAIQGYGVAIADEHLVAADIKAGRLVRLSERAVPTGAAYRLVLRQAGNDAGNLNDFRRALLSPDLHGVSSPA